MHGRSLAPTSGGRAPPARPEQSWHRAWHRTYGPPPTRVDLPAMKPSHGRMVQWYAIPMAFRADCQATRQSRPAAGRPSPPAGWGGRVGAEPLDLHGYRALGLQAERRQADHLEG